MASATPDFQALDETPNDREFDVYIAIDFGTDGLGIAYAIGDEVYVHSKWNSEKYRDVIKPKTIILLDEQGEIVQFGMDAKEVYMKLASSKKNTWMLFDRFKMDLYDDQIKVDMDDDKKNDDEKEQLKQVSIKSELTAVNGQTYSSEQVFILVFKHIAKEAKKFLRKQKIKWKQKQIGWIITVPAIWSDESKNKMQQWAIKAGLVDKDIKNQCKIVYEPDCASLAIQHHIAKTRILNQNIDNENDIENENNQHVNQQFEKGDTYILIDAGGGTVDIACHEIIAEFGVKEIMTPTGGKWGSGYIDDQYENTLRNIFGPKLMKEFKKYHPNVYVEMLYNFQLAKASFFDKQNKTHNCRLPDDMIAFLDEKMDENDDIEDAEELVRKSKMGQNNLVTLADEYLALDSIIWKQMFDYVIEPIIQHTKHLLLNNRMRSCKYLCLVGGLSCSKYFQHRMRQTFGDNLQLIIPERPILSVVFGAAYFGITKNYVRARKIKKTYGLGGHLLLHSAKKRGISDEYIAKNTYYHSALDETRILHCLSVMVKKNQEIVTDEIIKKRFSRVGALQEKMEISIISSDKEDAKVVSDGVKMATCIFHFDENDKPAAQIAVEFHFYDTVLKVVGYRQSNPDDKQELELIYSS